MAPSVMDQATSWENLIVIAGLLVIRQICEIVAKQIPDSATGWQAGVRMLFRTLALHVTNKE